MFPTSCVACMKLYTLYTKLKLGRIAFFLMIKGENAFTEDFPCVIFMVGLITRVVKDLN